MTLTLLKPPRKERKLKKMRQNASVGSAQTQRAATAAQNSSEFQESVRLKVSLKYKISLASIKLSIAMLSRCKMCD